MHDPESRGPGPRGSSPVRLLIVEDHAALGEALLFAFGFEDGIEAAGVTPSIEQGLKMLVAEKPDVVLMDRRLPDGSGIDAATRMTALSPGTAVIIMTAHADHLVALQAADAGAAGFLLKDVRITKIVAGVRRAVAGEPAIDPAVLQSVLAQAAADGSRGTHPPLQPPELGALERQVLILMAQAFDRSAIAARLAIAEDEVAALSAAVQERLGARSSLEAMVRAARSGLLEGLDQGPRARISRR